MAGEFTVGKPHWLGGSRFREELKVLDILKTHLFYFPGS